MPSNRPPLPGTGPEDILDLMAELVCVTDAEGRMTYVNPAWERATGYSLAEATVIRPVDMIAPEDRGRYIAAGHRLDVGEVIAGFEAVLLTKHGARLVGRGMAHPYMADAPDGSGAKVYAGSVAIYTDVTAERRAEVTRARLAATLDASSDFVGMMTASGETLYVNRAGRQMLKLSEQAAAASIVPSSVHPPEEWERLQRDVLPRLARESVLVTETVLVAADGERIPASQVIVAHPAFGPDEPPYFVSTVIRDLRERVRAEAALRQSERRFRGVLETVRAIAATLDVDANVVFANDYLLELTGWTREEVIGTSWFDRFFPDPEAGKAAFERLVTSGESERHAERPLRTHAGEERIIEWDHTVLHDADGRVIGTASLGHDVTERRRAERLKNELIGIVSHELRGPIGIVRGALELLRGHVTGEPARDAAASTLRAAELLALAERNTGQALRLVNDLLYLERLESGTLSMEVVPVAVGELLAVAQEATGLAAERAGVAVVVDLPQADAARRVSADPARVHQVLVNLVTNAIKFSEPGGTVTLSAAADGDDTVRITVRDHGRGIPADMLGRVFERFVQVRVGDVRSEGGAGLGLAICKVIVEQHGGRIWVESEAGAGSAFHVTLPAVRR